MPKLARQRGVQLALDSDDDSVRARLTMFFIERDKPSRKAETPVSNLTQINNIILNAQKELEQEREKFKNP